MGSQDEGVTTEGVTQCKICRKRYPPGAEQICADDYGELVPIGDDPLIGTYIDNKYELISFIGEGGMSTVYKARHRYMDRLVAVKLLQNDSTQDPEERLIARRRFELEAKAASAIAHPNVVTVFDFGFTPTGQPYLVMDFLEGDSLADVLDRNQRIPPDSAIPIFLQLCDGLDAVHKAGLIHRDLKPSNVMLLKQKDGSELVKIVDFGIAQFAGEEGNRKAVRLTQTGQIYGSASYMSPEQFRGKELDARSDIYGMGCLMYEVLTGSLVFLGDTFGALVVQHSTEPPEPFSKWQSDVPDALEAVVRKCLEKAPDDRYKTVQALRNGLVSAGSGAGAGIGAGSRTGTGSGPGSDAGSATGAGTGAGAGSGSAAPNVVAAGNRTVRGWTVLKIALSGAVLLAVATGMGFFMFWDGPEGERGTLLAKLRWQLDMQMAQQSINQKDYPRAIALLTEAKDLALDFDDRSKRLATLQRLADADLKSGNQKDLKETKKELSRAVENQALIEFEETLLDVQKLVGKNQKPTEDVFSALSVRVLAAAAKLRTSHLYREEETLLWKAIETYQALNVQPDAIAEFEDAMTDCLHQQQRWPEIRWYLNDILKIRNAAVSYHSNPETLKNQIHAYLKLGQYDRDESNFKDSEVELSKALQLAEEHFSEDTQLMTEAVNSYADLLRQTGRMEEYKKFIARSDTLWYKQQESLPGGK